MSIIQEALKKAQGEFTKDKTPSKAPSVKSPDVPTRPVMPAAKPAAAKKTPSLSVPALVGVLTVLLMIYGLDLSLRYSGKNKASAGVSNKKAVSSKAVSSSRLKERFSSPLIDPANLIPSHMGQFTLSGIMYVENKPQAIINGYVMEEGDKINGATILAIEKDCVLLSMSEKENIRLDISSK